jgi:hypothetical protein
MYGFSIEPDEVLQTECRGVLNYCRGGDGVNTFLDAGDSTLQ